MVASSRNTQATAIMYARLFFSQTNFSKSLDTIHEITTRCSFTGNSSTRIAIQSLKVSIKRQQKLKTFNSNQIQRKRRMITQYLQAYTKLDGGAGGLD